MGTQVIYNKHEPTDALHQDAELIDRAVAQEELQYVVAYLCFPQLL